MKITKISKNFGFDVLIDQISKIKDTDEAIELLYSVYKPSFEVEEAVNFCLSMHKGQFRKSGEPYAIHPILVACIVAYLSEDESMVISSLLHDVVEDTSCTQDEVDLMFGKEVGTLVQGLTKIVEIRGDNLASSKSNEKITKSAMTFRNMLLVSIKDVRVLVVKLCDRLHNMLTLNALREDKQKRIAEETLVVYAPIAHRLGISSVKNYLEDLSFKYLMPNEYERINAYINSNNQQMQLNLNNFIFILKDLFLKNGFSENDFKIDKRIKHAYSVYLKMQRKGVSIEEVLDLLGVRILVPNENDCYKVLGLLHVNFNPLISRFKDYIALPKQNGYQTIHTTLFDSKTIVEAQIRTFDMHKTAELGVAAHWKYKDGGRSSSPTLSWLSDISLEKDKQLSKDYDEIDLYEYAKDSLYVEDIAVYSPKGKIFTLPRGSTVLDFAYEVHSEIGLKAKAAYVNKTKVPLLTVLKNGDIVKIITDNVERGRCSWVDSVKTAKAKAMIKNHCKQKLSKIDFLVSLNMLKTILGIDIEQVKQIVEKENLSKTIKKIATDNNHLIDMTNYLKKYGKKSYFVNKYEIKKQKFENIVVYSNHKFANIEFDYCCNPKRGDSIIGFRSAHNVIIHHKMCDTANKYIEEGQDMVFVKWSKDVLKVFKMIFSLENKKGALAEFLSDLARMQININSINIDKNQESLVDYFEIKMEVPENISTDIIRQKLQEKYKVYDLVSLDDAYSNQK